MRKKEVFALNLIDIGGHLSDMKDVDYRNTLAISTLLELLIEKDIISQEEFAHKAALLESETMAEIIKKRRSALKNR